MESGIKGRIQTFTDQKVFFALPFASPSALRIPIP